MDIVPLSDHWLFFTEDATSCTHDVDVDYYFVEK